MSLFGRVTALLCYLAAGAEILFPNLAPNIFFESSTYEAWAFLLAGLVCELPLWITKE